MTIGLRELVAPQELSKEQRGMSAIRVFLFDPDDTTSDVELPSFGQLFQDPEYLYDLTPFSPTGAGSLTAYVNLTCRKIKRTVVSSDRRKLQYECFYSNEPTDPAQFEDPTSGSGIQTDMAKLPVTMEHGGEMISIKPNPNNPNFGWAWKSTPTVRINQPLAIKVNASDLKLTMIVFDSNYDDFTQKCRSLLGKLNDSDMSTNGLLAMRGAKGSWLFVSASSEMYRDYTDIKKWQVELLFKYRNPDNNTNDEDGWQKILRMDTAQWDIPIKFGGTDSLYLYGDFKTLFDTTLPVTPPSNPNTTP
jgi:hypothetical protein